MSASIDTDIGKKLQRAREAQGLTIRELAHELGWPHSTLGNYESGRRGLPVSRLYDIAAALKLAPAALLTETPEVANLVDLLVRTPELAVQIRFVLDTLGADIPEAPE